MAHRLAIGLVCAVLLTIGCSRDTRSGGEQQPKPEAAAQKPQNPDSLSYKAGKAAHEAAKETGKAARAAGQKLDEAARNASEGWKEASREDQAKQKPPTR
jgi:PBP1b-binding outer membrane lipoprotein LpoB